MTPAERAEQISRDVFYAVWHFAENHGARCDCSPGACAMPEDDSAPKFILDLITIALRTVERETWESAENIHRKNVFCGAIHDSICPDLQEFRRRAQGEK